MSAGHEPNERIFRPDVTVAVVVPRDGRLLLVEERVRGRLVINQPAGHLEPGETLQEAACREAREETGWEVRLTALVGMYRWRSAGGEEFLRFAFEGTPVREHPGPLDDGIEQALWLSPSELEAQRARWRSPLVGAVVQDWLAGARRPLDTLRELR
jgi:8-oxo-dGTP pyrophosphatase MutT (NUDIX family)